MSEDLGYELFGCIEDPYFPGPFGMLSESLEDEYRER